MWRIFICFFEKYYKNKGSMLSNIYNKIIYDRGE